MIETFGQSIILIAMANALVVGGVILFLSRIDRGLPDIQYRSDFDIFGDKVR